MAEMGLAARPKRRRTGTTRTGKGRWRASDLVKRDFPMAGINQKWYGDGTDIDTDEGKLYLIRCWTWDHAGCWGSPWVTTTTRTWPTGRRS